MSWNQIPRQLRQIIEQQQQKSLKPVTKLRRPVSYPIQQYTGRARTPIANGYGTSVVAAGPGFATPVVVNHTQGVISNAASGTITIPATTAGNTLIVAICYDDSTHGHTISGMTLGGAAGNFIRRTTNSINVPNCDIWEDFSIPAAQTSWGVTFSAGSTYAAVDIYEVFGLLATGAFDQTSSNGATSAAWTSNASPSTTQAEEFIVGVAAFQTHSPTGPAAPWTNATPQSFFTLPDFGISGYQVATAIAAFTYSGTVTSSAYDATVATFLAAPTGTGTIKGQATVQVGPQGLGTVWYPQTAAIGTTTGAADTSTCQFYVGPLSQLQLISGTSYAGGGDSVGLPVPPLTPGYYIVAVWSGAKAGDVASLAVYGQQDAIVRPAN